MKQELPPGDKEAAFIGDKVADLVCAAVAIRMGADAATAHHVISELFSTENLAGVSKTRRHAEENEAELGEMLMERGFIFDIVDEIIGEMTLHNIPDPDNREKEVKTTDIIRSRIEKYLPTTNATTSNGGGQQPHHERLRKIWPEFRFGDSAAS